jgi:hypothetical protein
LTSNIEGKALLKKETADRKYIATIFITQLSFPKLPISEISSAEKFAPISRQNRSEDLGWLDGSPARACRSGLRAATHAN